ncbi:FtsX-like permease family protein [Dactylosporangium sp. AC04546]|uniref:FtsX-like permease family protein n=1 Tax=Dactylosporangium sp. AC04546 TaxID=2862460 RepID=UPI001EE0456C|nr:FtsX-like permease family protein [Dactylosporangium sp. AC04546]WVK88710.1 FtsX-like permease family protein [Dactylosporangium sp. AC04546]
MLTWLAGVLRRRATRIAATAAGIATAVALLATVGAFLGQAQATMTRRATAPVDVDWQVYLDAGADPAAALAVTRAEPGVAAAVPVRYADVPALASRSAGTVSTTGAAVVLGLPPGYRTMFPRQIRDLAGTGDGVLLAQQTAANLRAVPGTVLTVERPGLPAAQVTVAGIVDLPHADTLLATGRPGATAPPDNVLLLPDRTFAEVLDPLQATRPDLVTTQLHVRTQRQLPAAPDRAYTVSTGAARHLDAQLAGAGHTTDNLGAALDAARSDAAYATALFLFLATPGVALAGLLTATVVAVAAPRRRREQALLRTRGATARQVLALTAAEATVSGIAGAVAGAGVAAVLGATVLGGVSGPVWLAAAGAAGLAVAAGAVLLPAWRSLRTGSVAQVRAGSDLPGTRTPLALRLGLDVLALAAAGLLLRATTEHGYQLVVAPEGAPRIAVDYWAFAGPALLWLGAALLVWRIVAAGLRLGRPVLTVLLRPLAGPLAGTVAATLQRRRQPIATAATLIACATAFAVSTAVFTATYRQQAEVDARLTNGADVTVAMPPGATGGDVAATIAATPGVRHVETIGHRFAYVGADLQDLYAVRPGTVTAGAHLADAWFTGGTAAGLMRQLQQQPDGVLVSAETVVDFQLRPGDRLTLRITDTRTGTPVTVAFRFLGVVNEFPTAPTDSFLVANEDYVAGQAGAGPGTHLVDTAGADPAAVAAALRQRIGAGPAITDITAARATVGSSLAGVDLAGLTRIELGFAMALAVAAAGLVLAVDLAERRRTFTILGVLRARPRHLAGFVAAEACVVTAPALLLGAALGAGLAQLLVTILSGAFDPPPDRLALPWGYLVAVGLAVVAAAAGTVTALVFATRRPALSLLRGE